MSLLNLGINWADTQKRQFCESFILFPSRSSRLIICNLSHSIFSYVEIEKHLLENYNGQAFNMIQVLNLTCSPSLK